MLLLKVRLGAAVPLILVALISANAPAQELLAQAKDGSSSDVPASSVDSSSTPEKEQQLGGITVTARERSESIQDVPIAVTAFDADTVKRAGISSPGDFIQLTPNVSMVAAQNSGTDFLTIRGISQVRNGDPPVATIVDGVLQFSPNQFNQKLYDISDIEVLKGPQGAIYGRNAIGGAIVIATADPPEQLSGSVQAGVGNGGLRTGELSIGGPIATWQARYQAACFLSDFSGLIRNTYLNVDVDNALDRGCRGRLVAEPTDALKLDIQASHASTVGGALNYVFQPLFNISDPNDTSIPIEANNRGYDKRTLDHASVKADYDLAWANLTAIFAYDHVWEFFSGDQFPYSPAISANSPFGPGTDGTQTQYLNDKGRQVEIRLTSPSDQSLRWIAGAYYLGENRYLSSIDGLDLGLGILQVLHHPAPMSSANPTTSFLADTDHNDSHAVFGQLAYDVMTNLEAALALRYDYEDHSQRNDSTPEFDPAAGQSREATFNKWQPKFTLTYKPDKDLTVYGSYGEGFRSGGFNQWGTGAAAASVGLVGVNDLYQPETAKTVEIGTKWRWDNQLLVEANAFRTQDTNGLYFVFVGTLGAQVLTNIDHVNLNGAEVDAQWKVLPTLTLYASYGYTDSKIKSYVLDPADVGNKAPYIPRYTSNVGFQFTPSLSNSLNWLLRVDENRIGPQYWDPENSAQRRVVDLVNLRAGIETSDDTWSLVFWARNATNTKYNAEWVLGGFANIGEPRTFGLEYRYNFQAH